MDPRYWAFISYSHADEAAAAKLHSALESYWLPARLRKAHGLPRRLFPIFRDIDELEAAPGLASRLQDALDESRWLVVLCSPSAVASKYVNQEVEYFLSKQGARRLLCVLVQGEPPDCFPAAVRSLSEEPLAGDIRPGRDFELAKAKLVAALAGVGFAELRNREAQRRTRRTMLAVGITSGIAAAALAYWDLYHRVHIDHYANATRRYGTWVGVDRLGADVGARRSSSYQFARRGRMGPPYEVRLVGGQGRCAGSGIASVLGKSFGDVRNYINQPACSVHFEYGVDGAIQSEVKRSHNGKALETLTYTKPGFAQFTLDGYSAASSRTGIYYVEFDRDARGLDRSVRYFHSRGVPRPNEYRHFGYAFGYDTEDRVESRQVLDEHGKDVGETTIYRRGPLGSLLEVRHEDAGRPRQDRSGCFGYVSTYDAWGNRLDETCVGADRRPSPGRRGAAGERNTYDPRGNLLRTVFVDRDGRPAMGADGHAEVRYEYDQHGAEVRRAYFDAKGQPAAWDAHGWTTRYDAAGNKVEIAYFDKAGKPTCVESGVCIWRIQYDARGNPVGQSYFDVEGRPLLIAPGAAMRTVFDDAGQVLEVVRLGLDGKPFTPLDLGYAKVRLKLDERGNTLQRLFLDAEDRPVTQSHGAVGAGFQFDGLGNPVQTQYLGRDLRPTRTHEGFAISRRKFDRLGQPVEETYFDEQGRPAMHRSGYFGLATEYDARGRPSAQHYLDAQGRPMKSALSQRFGVRYVRGPYQQVLEEQSLGADGEGLRGRLPARTLFLHDEAGREVERRHLDGDGNPIASPGSGCAIQRTQHDEAGRVVAERCLDGTGKAANRLEGGWSVRTIAYQDGRAIRREHFDAAGRPVKPAGP